MENTTLNDGNSHESKKPVKRGGRKAKSSNKVNSGNTNNIGSSINNNITDMRRRYEMAYYKLLNELPHWKLEVIKSCKANKNFDDRVMNEFVKSVILLAEDTTKQILLTA